MIPWRCKKCGTPHLLKPEVTAPRCFRCDAELERVEVPPPDDAN